MDCAETMKARTAWMAAAWLISAAAATAGEWPAVSGAVLAVRTTKTTDPVIAFDAKGRELFGFSFAARGRALPGSAFEMVCDGGSFLARDAGKWIGTKLATAPGFAVEATIVPSLGRPESPATVLSYGESFALRQQGAGLSMTLGGGDAVELFPVEAGKPVHVLISCGGKEWTAYRDGKKAAAGTMPATRASWAQADLVMGSQADGTQPWRGRMEAVAIFPLALTAENAASQADAAAALRAGRPNVTALRFSGTLVRQASTSSLEDIRPYSRSLTAAEYKVDAVLSGDWKEPTITVLHWMIMDGKRLPLADRKPGTAVELSVRPLAQQPQLEGSRRDELPDTDLDAELFYCETE
jgi:hypothetical protein